MRPQPIDFHSRYQVRRNRRLVEPSYVRFASAIQAARQIELDPRCLWVDVVKFTVEPTGATPTDFRRISKPDVVWRGTWSSLANRLWRALIGR